MASTSLIAVRVESGIKQRFQALAVHQRSTESALLRRMVELSVQAVTPQSITALSTRQRTQERDQRVTIRLRTEDQRLLQARAAARGLAPATYVSLLVRSHLNAVVPLPEEELKAFKSSLRELAITRRYAQALVQIANKNGKLTGPHSQEVIAMIKVLEATHTRIKALLVANLKSWETGHGI